MQKITVKPKKRPPQKQGNSPKKDPLARSGEPNRTTLDDEYSGQIKATENTTDFPQMVMYT